MSRLTESQKREIRHNIYEQLWQDERISLASMARNLGLARNTVTSHFNYMMENEILFPPTLRLKMYKDLREYVYFLNFKKPLRVYQELERHPHVVYHVLMSGAFDMIVLADTPIDFESHPNFEGCFLQGPRSDYYYAHVSRDSYQEAFHKIKKIIETADFEESQIPMDFPRNEIKWSELEWKLFYDLKYNMRRPFTDIVKKHGISKWLFYQCYDRIKGNCITTVPYYPLGLPNYSDFYIILKTQYEKDLLDLYLKIPCAGVTFKVKDYLLAWINVVRTYSFKEFFGLLYGMCDHGLASDLTYAIPVTYAIPKTSPMTGRHLDMDEYGRVGRKERKNKNRMTLP